MENRNGDGVKTSEKLLALGKMEILLNWPRFSSFDEPPVVNELFTSAFQRLGTTLDF